MVLVIRIRKTITRESLSAWQEAEAASSDPRTSWARVRTRAPGIIANLSLVVRSDITEPILVAAPQDNASHGGAGTHRRISAPFDPNHFPIHVPAGCPLHRRPRIGLPEIEPLVKRKNVSPFHDSYRAHQALHQAKPILTPLDQIGVVRILNSCKAARPLFSQRKVSYIAAATRKSAGSPNSLKARVGD